MKLSKKVAISSVGIIAITVIIMVISKIQLIDKKPSTLLEPGWQFYSKPTTLEPPGTVFRIDKSGSRFVVDVINVLTTTGKEAFGNSKQTIRTSAMALSRFIGNNFDASARQNGFREEMLEFELIDVEREITTDVVVEKTLKEFPSKVEYREDNRYFIIRESRSANEIHYTLSEELLNEIGGSASLLKYVDSQANFSYQKQGEYILSQKLPSRMRVMFLAEEIIQTSASLTGGMPEFGTAPITKPLVWK
jgi:hypothetical protein